MFSFNFDTTVFPLLSVLYPLLYPLLYIGIGTPFVDPIPIAFTEITAADLDDVMEECNGEDDNCDGTVDNDPTDPSTWYALFGIVHALN